MKKIGFIDYRIDEWHANHYPEWIKNAAEALKLDYTVAYAYASENAPDGRTTEEWCRDFGVERCHSIDEVCQKSDVLLVLAPSNPETHLGFAKAVLPSGKPTYIDKTFAPDTATALEIFALAEAIIRRFSRRRRSGILPSLTRGRARVQRISSPAAAAPMRRSTSFTKQK